jgi:hypothetical protein
MIPSCIIIITKLKKKNISKTLNLPRYAYVKNAVLHFEVIGHWRRFSGMIYGYSFFQTAFLNTHR